MDIAVCKAIECSPYMAFTDRRAALSAVKKKSEVDIFAYLRRTSAKI